MQKIMTIKQLSIGNCFRKSQGKNAGIVFVVACCVLLSSQANAVNSKHNMNAYQLGNATYTINNSNAEWTNPHIVKKGGISHPNKENIKKNTISTDHGKLIDSSWVTLHEIHTKQGHIGGTNLKQNILNFHYSPQGRKNVEFDVNLDGHLGKRHKTIDGHLHKRYKIETGVSINVKFKLK